MGCHLISAQTYSQVYDKFEEQREWTKDVTILNYKVYLSVIVDDCVNEQEGHCSVLYEIDRLTGDSLSSIDFMDKPTIYHSLEKMNGQLFHGARDNEDKAWIPTYVFDSAEPLSLHDTLSSLIDTTSQDIKIYGIEVYDSTLINFGSIVIDNGVSERPTFIRQHDLRTGEITDDSFVFNKHADIYDLHQMNDSVLTMAVYSDNGYIGTGGKTWYSLINYNINTSAYSLLRDVEPEGPIPSGCRVGINDDLQVYGYRDEEATDELNANGDFISYWMSFYAYDHQGEQQWEYDMISDTIDHPFVRQSYIRDITACANGDFLVCGYVHVFNFETWLANEIQAFIVRIDSSGNQVYLKMYEYFDDDGNRYDCSFNAVKEDSDGYLVACGVVYNDSTLVSPWLVRVNAEGCFEDGVDCEISDTETVIGEAEVLLYPNPVTSLLSIESGSMIASIEVYSITGQPVATIENVNASTASIETFELGIGVYQLVIHQSDGRSSKHRFVKH